MWPPRAQPVPGFERPQAENRCIVRTLELLMQRCQCGRSVKPSERPHWLMLPASASSSGPLEARYSVTVINGAQSWPGPWNPQRVCPRTLGDKSSKWALEQGLGPGETGTGKAWSGWAWEGTPYLGLVGVKGIKERIRSGKRDPLGEKVGSGGNAEAWAVGGGQAEGGGKFPGDPLSSPPPQGSSSPGSPH